MLSSNSVRQVATKSTSVSGLGGAGSCRLDSQGSWPVLPLATMVVHQIDQGGFEVIAKSPALWTGAVEVTAHEAQGKLLSQFVGDIGIAHGPQEITIRCPAVACQESRQIVPCRPSLLLVRVEH